MTRAFLACCTLGFSEWYRHHFSEKHATRRTAKYTKQSLEVERAQLAEMRRMNER